MTSTPIEFSVDVLQGTVIGAFPLIRFAHHDGRELAFWNHNPGQPLVPGNGQITPAVLTKRSKVQHVSFVSADEVVHDGWLALDQDDEFLWL